MWVDIFDLFRAVGRDHTFLERHIGGHAKGNVVPANDRAELTPGSVQGPPETLDFGITEARKALRFVAAGFGCDQA